MLSAAVTYLIVPLLGLYAYMAFMLWLAIAMGWEIQIEEDRDARHPRTSSQAGGDHAPRHRRGVAGAPRPASGLLPRSWGRMT